MRAVKSLHRVQSLGPGTLDHNTNTLRLEIVDIIILTLVVTATHAVTAETSHNMKTFTLPIIPAEDLIVAIHEEFDAFKREMELTYFEK